MSSSNHHCAPVVSTCNRQLVLRQATGEIDVSVAETTGMQRVFFIMFVIFVGTEHAYVVVSLVRFDRAVIPIRRCDQLYLTCY